MPETAIDWNAYAECYDALQRLVPYQELMQDVAQALARFAPRRILDAGCGTGNLIDTVHHRMSTTVEIIGIDNAPHMLARARTKCPYATFSHADMDAGLPFLSGTFDAIACVNALYASRDPAHLLAEFRRVLVQNGVLIIATPKRGYENGLILKAHCKSTKPDTYWLDAHASESRESALIYEAMGDISSAQAIIALARVNRDIARNTPFHFLTAEELTALVIDAGFTLIHHQLTYADQSHLMITRVH